MSLNIKTETGREMLASLGGNVINGAEMQHYSTEERIIGYWTDGKPLYRKVVDFGVLPNTSSKTVSANIPNLDKIIKIDAMRHRTSDNGGSPLPYLTFNITNLNLSVSIFTSEDDITIVTFSDRSNETATVIIEYTKTTDQPITNNNTYSTDEVLTGKTWIDGKPLYRKVINQTLPSSGAMGSTYKLFIISNELSNYNIDKMITMKGLTRRSDGWEMPIPTAQTEENSGSVRIHAHITFNEITNILNCVITTGKNDVYENQPITFIIEYTKTTD